MFVLRGNAPRKRQSVHARHIDVGKTAVDGLLLEDLDGLQAVAGRHHLITPAFEILAGDSEDALLVIDKQNGFVTGLVHETALCEGHFRQHARVRIRATQKRGSRLRFYRPIFRILQ
ncbi:MAG: hypothetical protein U5R30_00345 [Deltaproteobacteria bacterium]|nr:hypothetical protein [Deltaproteobacteria bacterium]